ncbi:MAG: hypothetical protein FJ100_16835 [Deltaproteobacteria bacterium]|nr:hypothetical protein [Deltaproteobacteria bacterium]
MQSRHRLAPYFNGLPAAAELERCRKALQGADASQEAALTALTADTRRVYAVKGRIVDLIEECNAVARNAFDGNAAIIGQFNKDLLLRGRRKGGANPDGEDGGPAPV